MTDKLTDEWYKYCYPNLVSEGKWKKLIPKELRPDSELLIRNIYYVNGVWNEFGKAQKFSSLLLGFLKDAISKEARVRLVYNKTEGLMPDLIECMLDKTWVRGKPILNPTTISLISILYNALGNNRPIGIVCHSQGTLITYNAIVEFSKITNSSNFLKNNVKVFLCAPMIHSSSLSKLEKLVSCSYFTHKNDPLPGVIGSTLATTIVVFIDQKLDKLFGPDAIQLMSAKVFANVFKSFLSAVGKLEDFKQWRKNKLNDPESKLAYHDFEKGYITVKECKERLYTLLKS
jgi:hypothetical protein